MKTDIRLLYVTTKDLEEARTIAKALIEKKLVACANIFPQMESLYMWEGKLEKSNEGVLILKTDSVHTEKATKLIESLHSYQTPCVLALPIESGAKGYLDWLKSEMQSI